MAAKIPIAISFSSNAAKKQVQKIVEATASDPAAAATMQAALAKGAAAGQAIVGGATPAQIQAAMALAAQGVPADQAAARAVGLVHKDAMLDKALPVGLAVLGAVGGFFAPLSLIALPIRVVAGGVLGLLFGAAVAPKAPGAAATMHGEDCEDSSGTSEDDGLMGVNFDDTTGQITGTGSGVQAGEIGLSSDTDLKG